MIISGCSDRSRHEQIARTVGTLEFGREHGQPELHWRDVQALYGQHDRAIPDVREPPSMPLRKVWARHCQPDATDHRADHARIDDEFAQASSGNTARVSFEQKSISMIDENDELARPEQRVEDEQIGYFCSTPQPPASVLRRSRSRSPPIIADWLIEPRPHGGVAAGVSSIPTGVSPIAADTRRTIALTPSDASIGAAPRRRGRCPDRMPVPP